MTNIAHSTLQNKRLINLRVIKSSTTKSTLAQNRQHFTSQISISAITLASSSLSILQKKSFEEARCSPTRAHTCIFLGHARCRKKLRSFVRAGTKEPRQSAEKNNARYSRGQVHVHARAREKVFLSRASKGRAHTAAAFFFTPLASFPQRAENVTISENSGRAEAFLLQRRERAKKSGSLGSPCSLF